VSLLPWLIMSKIQETSSYILSQQEETEWAIKPSPTTAPFKADYFRHLFHNWFGFDWIVNNKSRRYEETVHIKLKKSGERQQSTALLDSNCSGGRGTRILRQYFKLLRSPGIDSKESISPAYVTWRTGMTTLFLLGSYPP
jgi:hypothetical protein